MENKRSMLTPGMLINSEELKSEGLVYFSETFLNKRCIIGVVETFAKGRNDLFREVEQEL